jgi:hypothetical protein
MVERYCGNCRALIPVGSDVCPACGVYAGDVFDGKLPKQQRRRRVSGPLIFLLALIIAGGAYWYFNQRPTLPRADTGPVRVVGDRPGGGTAGAEAAMTLRHYFAAQQDPIKSECLAIINRGYNNGYYSFDAFNSCNRTRLGRWRVEGKTRKVTR